MNIKLILLLFISLIFNSQIIPQNIFKQKIEAQKTDEIDKKTFSIGVKNPNIVEIIDERTPLEILNEIEESDKKISKTLIEIKKLL